MELRRQVCRALRDEHAATVALLQRLEILLGRHDPRHAPDSADPTVARLLKDFALAVETEIAAHFAFEEEAIFPALAESGESEMVELLLEEHRAILPLARGLAAIARAAGTGGFSAESWSEFQLGAGELVEGLTSHIQKEDMGMLPALDDILDEAADQRLGLEMAERR